MASTPWTLRNDQGLDLLGDAHVPAGGGGAVAIIVHGYKGYKDYGMFPLLATRLCAAGIASHRFNLSCSGMTNDTGTFARLDLFELDTWGRQVGDVLRVIDAVTRGDIAGRGLPLFILGHSRGGTTTLLTAGRRAAELDLAGIVTINAPSACCSLAAADRDRLLERGFAESPSARTGQTLRVGRAWLDEQLADPAGHDVLGQSAKIGCDALVLHGTADETVPPAAAGEIAAAIGSRAKLCLIEGGNHVLNTVNPTASDADPSEQLAAALREIEAFVDKRAP